MSNQIFYISGNRKFYINENSGVLVLNNLDLRTNSRPTINGTGVLLSGEGATLPSAIVYNTGNQTISGNKTFLNNLNVSGNDGKINLDDNNSINWNGNVSIYGDGEILNIDCPANLNINGPLNLLSRIDGKTGTFQKLYADNLVYNTGNQTISGNKTFANNLQVSGTGIFNALDLNNIDNLSLSGVDVTITSGVVSLTNRPTVNGTGVLLSGQNSFIINLYNASATQAAGNNFFGNVSAAFSTTAAGVNRRFPVLESCVVRRATWTQFVQTTGVPSLNSTGYFINTTTSTTGIISTTINTQSTSTPTHYIAEFSPPITISSGDYIVCNLFGPTYATAFPDTVRNSVNLYCYN